MILKNLLLLLTILAALMAGAQQAQPLDTTAIRKAVADTSRTTGYRLLLKQFNETPRFLYPYEGAIIYYGKLFSKDYDAFKNTIRKKKFDQLLAGRKTPSIVKEGEQLLLEDPTSLKVLMVLMTSYQKTGDTTRAMLTRAKIDLLVPAILMHGNGLSKEASLKVTSIEDEYALMAILGFRGESRKTSRLERSFLDVWQANHANSSTEKELFFEVLYPF